MMFEFLIISLLSIFLIHKISEWLRRESRESKSNTSNDIENGFTSYSKQLKYGFKNDLIEKNMKFMALSYCEKNKKISAIRESQSEYLVSFYDIDLLLELEFKLNDFSPVYQKIDDNIYIRKTVQHSGNFCYFKVLFDESIIELSAKIESYLVKNEKEYNKKCGLYLFHFDFKGNKVKEELIEETDKYSVEETVVKLNDDNSLSLLNKNDHDYEELIVYINSEKKHRYDILNEDLYSEKEWGGFEYKQSFTLVNEKNQFAFITQHPHWSAQGVKIFELQDDCNIKCLYDLDDTEFDGTFCNLAFNKEGNKFIVLISSYTYKYYSILEYTTKGYKPDRVSETMLKCGMQGTLYIHYLTDHIVCIVRHFNFFIHYFEGGKKDIIVRDDDSPYLVQDNSIYYLVSGTIHVKTF